MVIISSGGQVQDLLSRVFYPCLPRRIRITVDAIRVADIKPVVEYQHAKRLIEVGEETIPEINLSILIAVPQKNDAVGTRVRVGPRFGNQNISIGRYIH